jgi:hypothetical protein
LKRTPLRRGRPLRARSDRAARRQAKRARNMHDAYGWKADCRGRGIIPVCPTRPHPAATAHEPGKRSQGADPTDPAQAIPVCEVGHRWIHDHPAQATELHTAAGQPFLIQRRPPC